MYSTVICLVILRKTTKKEQSRCFGGNSNATPHGYKLQSLRHEPTCSIKYCNVSHFHSIFRHYQTCLILAVNFCLHVALLNAVLKTKNAASNSLNCTTFMLRQSCDSHCPMWQTRKLQTRMYIHPIKKCLVAITSSSYGPQLDQILSHCITLILNPKKSKTKIPSSALRPTTFNTKRDEVTVTDVYHLPYDIPSRNITVTHQAALTQVLSSETKFHFPN
jgi:hypothetical protein